jgi:hypothetical protein
MAFAVYFAVLLSELALRVISSILLAILSRTTACTFSVSADRLLPGCEQSEQQSCSKRTKTRSALKTRFNSTFQVQKFTPLDIEITGQFAPLIVIKKT